MDTGDVIALVAVVVSVGAAGVSIHQANTAKDSAKSARVQADAAREANDLTRQQMQREESREQAAQQQAQETAFRNAEMIGLKCGNGGGSIIVKITNASAQHVTEVELLKVAAAADGPWEPWTATALAGGTPESRRAVLHTAETMQIPVRLLTTSGQRATRPQHPRALIRFRDADGQWWRKESGGAPERTTGPQNLEDHA